MTNSFDVSVLDVLSHFKEQGEVEKQLLPRLPEQLFVTYFLPLFKGDIKDPEVAQDLRTKWYTLARHPQGEINIIDNAGNVLYTTPSVNYTKMFDPLKAETGGSFKDLLAIANQLGSANPVRARQYLDNNLTKKFNAMRQKGHILTNEETRWLEIFKRYETNVSNNSTVNPVSSKINNVTDDDLVEDDD